MTDRELMQEALDALEEYCEHNVMFRPIERRDALRARLAQPKPDYEAEFIKDWNEGKVRRVSDSKRMVPEREWVGLTDEDIQEIHYQIKAKGMGAYKTEDIYRAIEAKLKENNA